MLRMDKKNQDVWEALFPPGMVQLNEELQAVDRLLEDERFFTPFREKFKTRTGRPTVPIATYLRMMYLKHRYQLGYEVLVQEVSDHLKWRRFCHLGLEDKVPEASTLIKLTHKYGEEVLQDLNRQLVLHLKQRKVVRGKKLRVDTTVVEANIHYPTDASLLADGVRVVTRLVKKLVSAGQKVKVRFRDRSRTVRRTLLELVKFKGRRSEVQRRVARLVGVTQEVVRAAQRVLEQSPSRSKACAGVRKKLGEVLPVVEQVIGQTRQVLGGRRHIRQRVVSLFDSQARPICRGKRVPKVEFGYKVLLSEGEQGIITGYRMLEENPADCTLLVKAVQEQRDSLGTLPQEVATDRGFWSGENERELQELGVQRVSIPVRGRKGFKRKERERSFWFRRLQRFRAGQEAKISLLKRRFGLQRSLLRGQVKTAVWVGLVVLTQNLWEASRALAPP